MEPFHSVPVCARVTPSTTGAPVKVPPVEFRVTSQRVEAAFWRSMRKAQFGAGTGVTAGVTVTLTFTVPVAEAGFTVTDFVQLPDVVPRPTVAFSTKLPLEVGVKFTF